LYKKKGVNTLMIAANYSTVRENLKSYCDKVNKENEIVIITRKDNKNVVLISEDEYNNMLENIKIIKDPKYLLSLFKTLNQFETESK